jgi:hypothetical protein
MSVWLTIPSARPAGEIALRLQSWRDMGYKIALWRNGPHYRDAIKADFVLRTELYEGWGKSINVLTAALIRDCAEADWFVGGGDDTNPDPNKRAEEIANECADHFSVPPVDMPFAGNYATFGVMQPTGDRWGENDARARKAYPDAPAVIDRICGSPWIGREFARRMNGGQGPFWPQYKHMFGDEELQCVALRMGVLWQRRDLTHYHDNPRREDPVNSWGKAMMICRALLASSFRSASFKSRTPDFAHEIYSKKHWSDAKALFDKRKAEGFPGSEPIA